MKTEYIDKLETILNKLTDAGIQLNDIGKFEQDRIFDGIRGMFDRFGYKVGDRVKLTKTPHINEKLSPGWMSFKHFLVEGKCGEITEVSFHDGKFHYLFKPDNQTWIPSFGEDKGKELPVSNTSSSYHFSEDYLTIEQ